MTREVREDLERYIREHATEYFKHDKSGKGYVCPICGSGTGENGTGITENPKSKGHFTCWGGDCFKNADIFEIIGKQFNLTDFNEIFSKACEIFRIRLDSDNNNTRPSPKPKTTKSNATPINSDNAEDLTEFFRQAAANIEKTDYHRGISLDTLNRFKVGYVERWRHPKVSEAVPTSPRLIIPTSKHSYIARYAGKQDIPKKYQKQKVGKIHYLNILALWKSESPVFIVEGEIDALSIIDVGGEAVALGSTAYVSGFIEAIKNAQQKPAQPLIIALDNDKAGQEAAAKLSEGLDKLDIPYFEYNIAKPYKDANEFLMQDRQGLIDKVKAVNLNPEQAIYSESNVYSHLQEFLDGIAESVNTPYIPTGFKALDSVLDGGFYEGLYIIGAISSLGKTTLAMQICDNIANSGNDVLMFSLEMARSELMAKSISRLTLLDVLQNGGDTRNAKTGRGVTTGSRWKKYSQTERELIQRAAETYGTYAKNIYIHEGIGDIGTSQIRQIVGNHIRITGKKPLVLVDYLQILAKADARTSDKQDMDRNVLELKRISRDFKIPVFVVSSFNRENYKTAVSYASFKESGAIEYSSDVLIGLQMKGAGEKGFDAETAKTRNPREIELVILKNRNGETGKKLEFKYYPMFNYFEEIGIPQKQTRL